MSFNNIVLMALCLVPSRIIAQPEQQEIRLLDLENALPIAGATFDYGEQQGLSDDRGIIRFRYTTGSIMNLSHVNYGSWTLDDAALKKAIQQHIYYWESVTINLYPVTIIAVRPSGPQPDDQVKISYQERLEHDGAAILNQAPAFNSIRKSGNYGFDPVFRGFKYDQLNVVLNGAQSATAACPNRMDPPPVKWLPI